MKRWWKIEEVESKNQNQEKIEDEDEKHETSEVDLRGWFWFWFDFDQNRFNEKKNDLASTVSVRYIWKFNKQRWKFKEE